MRETDNREHEDAVIELGSVSLDTKGGVQEQLEEQDPLI